MRAGQADNVRHGDEEARGSWTLKYGERHKLVRVDLPVGVAAPAKVRIYARAGHFV